MSAVTTPIREAYRLGKITRNPAQNFRGLANHSKRRGILSAAEMQKLFDLPWEFESHRLAVAAAFYTGTRLGEIQALTVDDLDIDFEGLPVVWIKKSFSPFAGIKSIKTENVRIVPISAALRDDLLRLSAENPHGKGFIFWGPEPDKPMTARVIEWGFCKQLQKIEKNKKTRKEKGICFHSTRHNFNSALRGKIADETLRLAAGHADPHMSDHYDHLTDKRLKEIREA
jgi:integrase